MIMASEKTVLKIMGITFLLLGLLSILNGTLSGFGALTQNLFGISWFQTLLAYLIGLFSIISAVLLFKIKE